MTTTERPHGRVKYVVEKCRCDVCRADSTAYENNRARQLAYGRWQPYVDAEPVRAHVRQLQAGGLGSKHLAVVSGVPHGAISKLIYGDYGGSPPSKRIRAATAAKLLAVTATLDNLGATVKVDATGTRRRLQALVAIGWSQSKLAARLGMQPGNFGKTLKSEKVNAATARAVRDLYDELWQTLPPREEHRDKIAFNRARNHAKRHGWAPPLAWDDDTIDNPSSQPEGQGQDKNRRKLPPADELRWLMEQGDTIDAIAQRFRASKSAIEHALARDGRAA